jgi:DNA-binding GntR family transcriptional regulator
MTSLETSTLGWRGGQQVRQWLLEMLTSGRYVAGSKLPTERAVAGQLGVPRSALRNALAALEAEGLVIRLICSGTFVAETLATPPRRPARPSSPSATPAPPRSWKPAC